MSSRSNPLRRRWRSKAGASTAAWVWVITVLFGQSVAGAPPNWDDALRFQGTLPRHLQPAPASAVPAGLPDVRAETCGACHVEFYAEWAASTHARAFAEDAQFMAELEKSRGQGVDWMCVNCHTPVIDQLPSLVAGFVEGALHRPLRVANPRFDPRLQAEAVTCAACHVRDGVVLGPYGDTAAPHPVRRDPALLDSARCAECHQAVAYFAEQNLACVFDTAAEVAAGPHAGVACSACHMPVVERPLVPGGPVRQTRRHWFGGSGIPKRPQDEAALAEVRAHFPEGLAVDWIRRPVEAVPGAPVTVEIEVRNAAAGHMLPTGDPERYLLVTAQAQDGEGRTYASATWRYGQVWRWHPKAERLADTRLAPGEARVARLRFVIPEGPNTARRQRSLTVRVLASSWRISPENLAYHRLEGRVVPGRIVHDRRWSVPVRWP